nr:uncharacterized protein LOC112285961 [Physcomitrium patens]|eukprot:XP_024383154.1 uncharacterized protein LOC112285961 [Physcomitrella patens]
MGIVTAPCPPANPSQLLATHTHTILSVSNVPRCNAVKSCVLSNTIHTAVFRSQLGGLYCRILGCRFPHSELNWSLFSTVIEFPTSGFVYIYKTMSIELFRLPQFDSSVVLYGKIRVAS